MKSTHDWTELILIFMLTWKHSDISVIQVSDTLPYGNIRRRNSTTSSDASCCLRWLNFISLHMAICKFKIYINQTEYSFSSPYMSFHFSNSRFSRVKNTRHRPVLPIVYGCSCRVDQSWVDKQGDSERLICPHKVYS